MRSSVRPISHTAGRKKQARTALRAASCATWWWWRTLLGVTTIDLRVLSSRSWLALVAGIMLFDGLDLLEDRTYDYYNNIDRESMAYTLARKHLRRWAFIAQVAAYLAGVTFMFLLLFWFFGTHPPLWQWLIFGFVGGSTCGIIETAFKSSLRQEAGPYLWTRAVRASMSRLPGELVCRDWLFDWLGRDWLIEQGVDVEDFVALGADSPVATRTIITGLQMLDA